ncbi:opsin-5 isoform X1 [Homo sapiens]|uniref:opsin-5 isoform X1 n=1 Tax=Homo sapiens TaxID=9606 RepID=UPI0007DC7B7C|nr:opsin-5 isoform X1 [Homo sapiens]XP_054210530.1 opsin-5 isoform X1 [Homo sapiens]|eukprot:XP_016865899.1 opsin-5 isoform X2 [Homo sapiens]
MSSRRKKKLRPAEIMTINLAVCDLGISVVGKPFTIISCFCHRWVFGWIGCRWYGWAGFFFGCGSLITMTAVSLDRYLKICYLSYGVWLKRKHAYICLAAIWAYASFWTTMPLIIAKVKSSSKEVAHFDSRIHSSHVLEMKLTKVAMLICAGFLIAWIPYAVVSVWSAFGRPDSIPIQLSVVPTLLAKSAAMYNPIIYQVIDYKFACCQTGGLKATKKKSLEGFRLHTVTTVRKSSAVLEIHEEDKGRLWHQLSCGENSEMTASSETLGTKAHSPLQETREGENEAVGGNNKCSGCEECI